MGARLDGLTTETLQNLQQVADLAEKDLGLNATTNGRHKDSGHAAGTAVDIGYLNGKDIGHGPTTNPGMRNAAAMVQWAASELGGLKQTGNLGPAGKFNGTVYRQINDPVIRANHRNHIHLSWDSP